MRERSLETTPAITLATTPILNIRKRRYTSILVYSTHPVPRVAPREFWTERIRQILLFKCNPQDFYKPFLKLNLGSSLVLCNNKTKTGVIRIFVVAFKRNKPNKGYYFPKIQHPNFVNICKRHLFEDKVFIFTKYIRFSIDDLLYNLVYLTKPEIAYIISQVSRNHPFLTPTFVNIASHSQHIVYLVEETRLLTHISREYPRVF